MLLVKNLIFRVVFLEVFFCGLVAVSISYFGVELQFSVVYMCYAFF